MSGECKIEEFIIVFVFVCLCTKIYTVFIILKSVFHIVLYVSVFPMLVNINFVNNVFGNVLRPSILF